MFLQKLKNNHLLMSGFYKGISGLSLFISIPLLITYFGNDNYGVWVLVFTLFQWVLLMDFGIQSSLKTKIPVLLHDNKIDLLKSYIKTTYRISFYIAFSIFILFSLFIYFVDIKSSMNVTFHSKSFVNKLFLINIFFFCINFVANIHKSLYVAFLKGKYSEESLAVNQFGFLVLVFIASLSFPNISVENKLIFISFINGSFCLFVNTMYTIRFFKLEKLNLKTDEKTPKDFIKEILKLGSKFMIIQLALMFIFTSDNYIISNNFSPKDVVPYDTVNKIFQLPILILFATLSPLWSMFAKDFIDKNHTKLLTTFKKFNLYFIGIFFFIIGIAAFCPFLISIWIKEKLEIPNHLILYIGIATSLRIFVTFYTFFLSGIGKLNKYILILLISVILKIPLTYYLIHLDFGINSVVVSTLILMLLWVGFIPHECYLIVNKLKKNE
jgi:O-antigen/teichoic acid export membrane protein